MAGFQLITYGRFWVFTEGLTTRDRPGVTLEKQNPETLK